MAFKNDSQDIIYDIEQTSQSILDQVDAYLQDTQAKNMNGSEDDFYANIERNTKISNGNKSKSMASHLAGDAHQQTHSHFGVNNSDWAPMYLDNNTYAPMNNETSSHGSQSLRGLSQLEPDMLFSSIVMPDASLSEVEMIVSPYLIPVAPGSAVLSANNGTLEMNSNTPFLRGKNGHDSNGNSFSARDSNSLRKKHSNSNFSPLSSPAMTPATNSKVVKSSPRINAINGSSGSGSRRSYVEQMRNNNKRKSTSNSTGAGDQDTWEDYLFKLPASSIGISEKPINAGENDKIQEGKVKMNYPRVILPSHYAKLEEQANNNDINESDSPMGNRNTSRDSNEERQTNDSHNNENIPNDRNNMQDDDNSNNSDNNDKSSEGEVLRATKSPVIRPRTSQIPWKSQISQTHLEHIVKDILPRRKASTSASSSSTALAGVVDKFDKDNQILGDYLDSDKSKKEEDSSVVKKKVHKVAEQERRNRLNSALHDLKALLPTELKDTAEIPSKATTVELACQYIRNLVAEIQDLK